MVFDGVKRSDLFWNVSDLPLAVNTNVTEEKEAKGQKRNGSPSLLVACSKTCGKKQCVLGDACSNKGFVEAAMKVEPASRESDLNAGGGSGGGGLGGLSLRKCSNTPNPSASRKGMVVSKTPTSVSRSSMFSPGDDFWNEAIQVADELLVPADEKVLMDKLSCVAPQGGRNISRSDSTELGGRGRVLDGCAKPAVMDIEGNEVSPLPVKHFDFARVGVNTIQNSPRQCFGEVGAGTGVDSGPSDSGSLGHSNLQPSNTLTSKEMLMDQPVCNVEPKFGAASLFDESLGRNKENGSCLPANDGSSEVSDQKHDITHRLQDEVSGYNASTKENICKSKLGVDAHYEEVNTPSSSVPLKDHLQLSSWLPSEVCSMYMKKGISKLYPWQVCFSIIVGFSCLQNPKAP